MTSPGDPPPSRPSSFDEWVEAFREQASFFTGVRLSEGPPRWPLSDVLPVLPVSGEKIPSAQASRADGYKAYSRI